MTRPVTAAPFRILVLCTGNVCRSPAGQLLLQHRLGDSVRVESAGTRAVVGSGVEEHMAARMPPSVPVDGFAARQLTPAMLREADLVIAMSREHRSRAVELFPGAVRRAFTLRELARVLSLPDTYAPAATPGDFLRQALPTAGQLRHRARPADPADDDVVDPIGRDDEVFTEAYGLIEAATRDIAQAASPA